MIYRNETIMINIVIFISMKLELITSMSQIEKERSEIIDKCQKTFQDEKPRKLIMYNLSTKEINDFYILLRKINKMNSTLIKHIRNIRHAFKYCNFCIYSLPSFAAYIQVVTKIRKNFENHHVCGYEFFKFCEFFYYALFHIMKYRNILLVDFFQFSNEKILPVLKKINTIINFYKSLRFQYWLNTKFRKKNNNRQAINSLSYSLSNLCFRILGKDNEKAFYERIKKKYSIDELPLLYVNVFVRFFLIFYEKLPEIISDFNAQKYPISHIFADILFHNGNLTTIIINMRINFNDFLESHHLYIERELLSQNIIPPVGDVMNKHAFVLNLC